MDSGEFLARVRHAARGVEPPEPDPVDDHLRNLVAQLRGEATAAPPAGRYTIEPGSPEPGSQEGA